MLNQEDRLTHHDRGFYKIPTCMHHHSRVRMSVLACMHAWMSVCRARKRDREEGETVREGEREKGKRQGGEEGRGGVGEP